VGRKKKNFDTMSAGFDAGTFDRIDAVLGVDDTRKDFVRRAVARELERLEKKQRKSEKKRT
jgi:hypothetical protein